MLGLYILVGWAPFWKILHYSSLICQIKKDELLSVPFCMHNVMRVSNVFKELIQMLLRLQPQISETKLIFLTWFYSSSSNYSFVKVASKVGLGKFWKWLLFASCWAYPLNILMTKQERIINASSRIKLLYFCSISEWWKDWSHLVGLRD